MKIILSCVTINTAASLSMTRNNCASKTSYRYEVKAKDIFLSSQPESQDTCSGELWFPAL